MSQRFIPATAQHIYQGTVDGVLIFYSLQDVLVFFSLFMCYAKKYRESILSLSLMPDHYHCVIAGRNRERLNHLVGTTTSLFTREYNTWYHRSGPLFRTPFGCADKKGTKAIISTINYSLNNQAVKKLCSRVEDTRMNFLAYALTGNPFSEKVNKAKVSRRLRRALSEMEACAIKDIPLNYTMLNRIMGTLDKVEQEQFADRTITWYNRIDYEMAGTYYGSVQNMILAANTNSGTEFGITEPFDTNDDRPYAAIRSVIASLVPGSMREILDRDFRERFELGWRIMKECRNCTPRHIERFLWLPDGSLHRKVVEHVTVKQHYRRRCVRKPLADK